VQDGHASTLAVLQGYVSKAKSLGVKFFENDAVTGISIQKGNGKVDSVATSQGKKFQTSKVLIAAGAYSGLVGKLALVDIPIKPYPRKVLVTASFTDSIPELIPIIVDVDSTLVVGREGRGVIFADNEPIESSFELKFPPEYDERVISKAVQRVSSLSKASVAYANMGLYELAPDANPIVSEIQGIDGLYCCAGFAGHGFMHAPAIGKIMAELMIDERTHLDISEYNLRRFFSSNNNEEKQQQASSERLII
jgi:sarcosine oxidase subunit beta